LNIHSEKDHTSIGNKNKIMPNDIQGKIEFKNVYFKYPINLNEDEKYNIINKKEDLIFSLEKEKYVLKDISFTINPGEKVALIGSSGSGKTTIIKLIERFYEPSKGHILIDGIDIKNYNLYELRKIVGLVNQDSIIFKRNIYDNIKYGNINASHNSIIEAAKNASIDYLLFNSNIINNSDENISYSKSKVSGGEKQRISIARIFLKKPKILLLDEPTSFMDRKNENEIIKNLDELMKGRTTLIATHRMDSIINASKILVFKNGQLIQNGIHKELINIEGEYKNLFALS
jgi:ABC-type multidrug transport system fused ATPase/permease subunit